MNKFNQKIPEGWNVKKLGDCVSYFKGFAFKSSCYKIIGTRVIRVSDMGYDSILSKNDSVYVDYQREYNKYILQEGDIIITTVGSKPPVYNSLVGRSIKVKKENNGSLLNQNAVCLRADKINTVQNYFPYLLKMKRYIFYIEDIIRGNANQGSITLEDLFNYHFLLPPLAEQEKIAGILGTWDEAIEKLSNLIEQKKLLKKGLMQKLLTGKIRLPGFTQPWKDCELSDLLDYEQPSKYIVNEVLEYSKTKTPVLTANKAFILGSTDDTSGIYTKGICIIFDDFTTDIKYVDFPFKVKSSAIKILTPKKGAVLKFVFEQMKRIKYPLGGHKRYYLSEYQYITISIPDTKEQQAIADVLSTADDEINLLNQKLEAMKEQKKGLMQQLLTGQIRVKVN